MLELKELNSRPPIQRYLIKAQDPCVVGFLVSASVICIDKISWGETMQEAIRKPGTHVSPCWVNGVWASPISSTFEWAQHL